MWATCGREAIATVSVVGISIEWGVVAEDIHMGDAAGLHCDAL